MSTVLVAYDDSRSGRAALERAVEMTDALDAELVVITVAPTFTNVGRSVGRFDPVDSPARRRQVLAEARAILGEHEVEARYVLATGRPADAIVQAAEEYGADLIVVGQRSTNPVKRLLAENVSESVRHKAGCDVLVARSLRGRDEAPRVGIDPVEHRLEPVHERLAA
jgi:nucleotide-binding universal stress UspA family protein